MVIEHFVETYGESPQGWGDICFGRIDADRLVAFAMTPEEKVGTARAAEARQARRATPSRVRPEIWDNR